MSINYLSSNRNVSFFENGKTITDNNMNLEVASVMNFVLCHSVELIKMNRDMYLLHTANSKASNLMMTISTGMNKFE